MTASSCRVMEPLGLEPSEMPSSTAQFIPASYQVLPVLVSTPAWRASTVISMPRVVEAAGEKAVEEVPVIRPLSTA